VLPLGTKVPPPFYTSSAACVAIALAILRAFLPMLVHSRWTSAEAESVAPTDWRQIVALYAQLVRIQPSPVVQLNRAVAMALRDGPVAGLAHLDAVLEHGELANYYLVHSARADMYRRLGRTAEPRASYEKALALVRQEPERRFLARRLDELK
jgi:RNA polymerase sigma-70 factor (ECF subfamily)